MLKEMYIYKTTIKTSYQKNIIIASKISFGYSNTYLINFIFSFYKNNYKNMIHKHKLELLC